MKDTTYHSLLRISVAVVAVVLLFDSGVIIPITHTISVNTQSYLAQTIGMTATVVPTELNEITAELTARDRELDAREIAINEREISVGITTGSDKNNNFSTYLLSIILFILLVLVVLNYALDFVREKRNNIVPA